MVTSNDSSGPVRDPETVAAAEAWARSAEFSSPLRWGAVEDAVLDQPLPSSGGDAASAAAKGAVRAVLAVVVGCSSLLGLAFVLVLRGSEDRSVQDFAGTASIFAFLVALAVVAASAFIWWDTGRTRSVLGLVLSGMTGVASAAALVAFQGATYDDDRSSLFIRVLTLAAAVVGLGLFGAILFGAQGPSDSKNRRSWRLDVGKELQYIVARNTVLDVLVERGLVSLDAKEKDRIASRPLGSWHELDAAQE